MKELTFKALYDLWEFGFGIGVVVFGVLCAIVFVPATLYLVGTLGTQLVVWWCRRTGIIGKDEQ